MAVLMKEINYDIDLTMSVKISFFPWVGGGVKLRTNNLSGLGF